MGAIFVLSTIASSIDPVGTTGSTAWTGLSEIDRPTLNKIRVKLKSGANENELRFFLFVSGSNINNNQTCRLYTYENGQLVQLLTKYLVSDEAKKAELYPNGAPEEVIAFMERGMTKSTLESIPASQFPSFSQTWGYHQISVLTYWKSDSASANTIFPVEKFELTGKRWIGLVDGGVLPPPNKVQVRSKTFEFSSPRTIKYSDFEIEGSGEIKDSTLTIPTDNEWNTWRTQVQCVAGGVLTGFFKKSNGKWSRNYFINETMPDQTDVIAMKLVGYAGVAYRLYTLSNGTVTGTTNQVLGPVNLNSVTFDRQSATGTYAGGNFTTKTLHLANVAKKVHATLVHKEGLNVKAYVSLRSAGNFVSGENLGTGNGQRQSVTLQHTNGLTNEGFKLYFNGVEQEVSSYSFASGSGLVTFTAPSGVSVKCDYYYNTGAENFVEMTRTATYRNEDKPGMLESQFKYETTTGGNVATLRAEVAGDGRIEEMAVFFNQ